MAQILFDFFAASGFVPHGYCLLWRADLIILHLSSDLVIMAAYLTIPIAIWRVVRSRGDVRYSSIAFLFALFIFACAMTHFFGMLTMWFSVYAYQGIAKLLCALVSGLTAVKVWRLVPTIIALPSPELFARTEAALSGEAQRRRRADREVRRAHDELEVAHRELHAAHAELEVRVAQRTAELSRANEDLVQFTYIASHDLRAPLRALMTLPEWLRETLAEENGSVSAAVEEDLAEMEVQSRRMDDLLNDLLTYAQIGTGPELEEEVDPLVLIQEAICMSAVPDGFSVELPKSAPRIRCIPTEFSLVIRNLISNAIRHHDRDHGKIWINMVRRGRNIEVEVRDDGPGINSRYAEQIFEMFTTLRSRDNGAGSGLGLAMVRKIVQRSHGQIQLLRRRGRGAAFQFSIPSAEGRLE